MQKILVTILLSIVSATAIAANNWSSMTCTGVDGAGKTITLTAQSDSPSITLNGLSLRILGKTKNGLGLFTENYVTVLGTIVYISLMPTSNTTLDIYQFNAVTEALLARVSLACTFSGNVNPTVATQPMFKLLQK